jgi:hypothetical protein
MPIGGKNLYSTNKPNAPSRKQLRSFGLIVAIGFLVIGTWPLIFRQESPRQWALAITVIFGIGALLAPMALRQPFRVWMRLGLFLGWINSKVILGALYYFMLTPTKLIMMVVGYDPMNRSFDRKMESYRVPRKARAASHMTHQF